MIKFTLDKNNKNIVTNWGCNIFKHQNGDTYMLFFLFYLGLSRSFSFKNKLPVLKGEKKYLYSNF